MKKLFILFIIAAFASCKQDYQDILDIGDKDVSSRPVEVEPIKVIKESFPVHAIGRVSTDKEVKLSFKIGGIISEINGDEGDYVRQGRTLASLRTNEINAQVLKAQSALEKTKRDLDRVTRMYKDSAATLENVEDLSTLLEINQADLEIATFNQTFSQIVSPYNGRIIRKLAEGNELVSPGQPVFIIAPSSGSSYQLSVALSDKDLTKIQIGDKADVFFDAFAGDTLNAQITDIAENADMRTGTFKVDLRLTNNSYRLRNGMIGRSIIYPRAQNAYMKIPMDAIVDGDDESISVFTVESDTIAREVQLKPLVFLDKHIAVRPLSQESEVITRGAQYLADGDIIEIQ